MAKVIEFLKFSASAIICFVVDFLLFQLFFYILGSRAGLTYADTLSTYIARAISAPLNFILNRKVVFKSDTSLLKSILQYVLLAVFIVVVNSFLVHVFITVLGMNSWLSKVLVESILFVVNYLIQHFIIFKKKPDHN